MSVIFPDGGATYVMIMADGHKFDYRRSTEHSDMWVRVESLLTTLPLSDEISADKLVAMLGETIRGPRPLRPPENEQ